MTRLLLLEPGENARAGLTWFPVERAKCPRGHSHVNTWKFYSLYFTFHVRHIYHTEAHLSGYMPFTFSTPTSITMGVRASDARVTCA